MKQILIAASLALLFANCKKQSLPEQETAAAKETPTPSAAKSASGKTARQTPTEMQTLIRMWTQWSYGKPLAQWPFADPDGHLQDLGQCRDCGVYLLAGGNLDQLYYTRSVTIDLAKYQYAFVSFAAISTWYDNCDMSTAPKNGQNPEAYFRSTMAQAFNKKQNLVLTWDGVDLISGKQQDYRANSGVFQFPMDPSFYSGCTAETSTWYTDGFFAKLPLQLGEHTLVFSGGFDWKKKMDIEAYQSTTYHINVIDTRMP